MHVSEERELILEGFIKLACCIAPKLHANNCLGSVLQRRCLCGNVILDNEQHLMVYYGYCERLLFSALPVVNMKKGEKDEIAAEERKDL